MWLLINRADRASILEKREEHQWYLRLGQLEKSAMAEHAANLNHEILFSSVEVLFQSDRYLERMICEALKIKLNPKELNKDMGLQLSPAWRIGM